MHGLSIGARTLWTSSTFRSPESASAIGWHLHSAESRWPSSPPGGSRAQARLGSLAPSTMQKYRDVLRVHVEPMLGYRSLNTISRADVEDMVDSISSPWQGQEALKLVRRLLNRALDEGRLARNVAARASIPETKRTKVRILGRC
jgi:hypothetical protein